MACRILGVFKLIIFKNRSMYNVNGVLLYILSKKLLTSYNMIDILNKSLYFIDSD